MEVLRFNFFWLDWMKKFSNFFLNHDIMMIYHHDMMVRKNLENFFIQSNQKKLKRTTSIYSSKKIFYFFIYSIQYYFRETAISCYFLKIYKWFRLDYAPFEAMNKFSYKYYWIKFLEITSNWNTSPLSKFSYLI